MLMEQNFEFLVIFEGFFTCMEQNSGEISQLQG